MLWSLIGALVVCLLLVALIVALLWPVHEEDGEQS